jgi:hypothetical protein
MRTAEKDVNYLSVSQGVWEYFSGSDNPEPAIQPIPFVAMPENPKDYDAILKISNSQGIFIQDAELAQGKENCVDCNNRAADCQIHGEFGLIGKTGEQVITVKGGCHHLVFSGVIYSKGMECDLEVGAWSDQSFDPSSHLNFISLSRANGQPITFKFGRVNNPISCLLGKPKDIILPINAKVLFWASLGEMGYWWVKWGLVKTGLIKWVKI